MTGREHSNPNDSGAVLILIVMVSMIIFGFGVTALWQASTSMNSSASSTRRSEALFAAETGLERARLALETLGPNKWYVGLRFSRCGATLDDQSDNGKGAILCADDGSGTLVPLENIPVTPLNATAAADDNPNNPITQLSTYSVWVKNDEEEYRYCDDPTTSTDVRLCNQAPKHDTTGTHQDSGVVVDTDSERRIYDADHRVDVRVEGLGRDGVSYVAIRAVVSSVGGGADGFINESIAQINGGPSANNANVISSPTSSTLGGATP